MRPLRFILFCFLGICMALAVHVRTTPAGEAPHETEESEELEFSPPLIADSPTPENELRFDYGFFNEPAEEHEPGADRHTVQLRIEYALARWFSLEVSVPYTFLNPDEGSGTDRLDDIETRFKYANFAFEEHGLVLGGGLAVGLPTGDEERGIGSDHVVDIEPFLISGFKVKELEIVGETAFGIPVNENDEDESDLELSWNLSFLYHITDRLAGLVEFDGEHVFGGEEDGFDVVNITPGLKYQPIEGKELFVGAGVRLPLTDDKDFYVNSILSFFYHF